MAKHLINNCGQTKLWMNDLLTRKLHYNRKIRLATCLSCKRCQKYSHRTIHFHSSQDPIFNPPEEVLTEELITTHIHRHPLHCSMIPQVKNVLPVVDGTLVGRIMFSRIRRYSVTVGLREWKEIIRRNTVRVVGRSHRIGRRRTIISAKWVVSVRWGVRHNSSSRCLQIDDGWWMSKLKSWAKYPNSYNYTSGAVQNCRKLAQKSCTTAVAKYVLFSSFEKFKGGLLLLLLLVLVYQYLCFHSLFVNILRGTWETIGIIFGAV